MISYPNLPTPPSSSEDSPRSVNLTSPGYQYYNTNDIEMRDCTQPYLHIMEEPVDKFRFRYKSEMAGTHGSLSGMTSDKNRKATFPTVELFNFQSEAIIRCSLYQFNANNIEELRQPHAHRLVKKNGLDEKDDPHDNHVTPQTGYQTSFHSMGIIHTAKKNILNELIKKKKFCKSEEIAREEGNLRPLTTKEEVDIKVLAENESKTINLNIVCLRFDAFVEKNGIMYSICNPVYSHAINNLKSALTGELKIVRMDHCSSPCSGGREIYILVEKVTKKNIRIRFFELDDDETEVWCDYGKFNDLDVHHQYAIVFKTPAYRDQYLDHDKKVYIELERPSDGARSDPKDFVFTQSRHIGAKRSRTAYSSSSSYNSYGNSSSELPTVLGNSLVEAYAGKVHDDELYKQDYTQFINSDEFKDIVKNELGLWKNLFEDNHLIDAPGAGNSNSVVNDTECVIKYEIPGGKRKILENEYKDILSFVKTKPSKERIAGRVDKIFNSKMTVKGDTLFHVGIMANERELVILIMILARNCNPNLLNAQNDEGTTALHLAVVYNNFDFVKKLLFFQAIRSMQDNCGNAPLHLAIKNTASLQIIAMLIKNNKELDLENSEGQTALQLAVKSNLLPVVEMLCLNGANVNIIDKTSGRNILHIAIEIGSTPLVNFLLHNTDIKPNERDYKGYNPLEMAFALVDEKPEQKEIYNNMVTFLKTKNLLSDTDIKKEIMSDEEDFEEEMENIKLENYSSDDLEKLYKNVTEIPKLYLEEIAQILDTTMSWQHLAHLLDMEYIVTVLEPNDSPAKNILNAALAKGESVLQIRNFLDNLEETDAVYLLDKMAHSR